MSKPPTARHVAGPVYPREAREGETYLGTTAQTDGSVWDWYEARGIATILLAIPGATGCSRAFIPEFKPLLRRILKKAIGT